MLYVQDSIVGFDFLYFINKLVAILILKTQVFQRVSKTRNSIIIIVNKLY